MRYIQKILIFSFILIISACGTESEPQQNDLISTAEISAEPTQSSAINAVATTTTTTAVTGELVTFEGLFFADDGRIPDRFEWVFSDGQTAIGETVTISFANSMTVTAELVVFSQNEFSETSSVEIIILPSVVPPNNFSEFLPSAFGDVDGDSMLTDADIDFLNSVFTGQNSINEKTILAADINFSGDLDRQDLNILSEAVSLGLQIPRPLSNQLYVPAAY